MRKHIIARVEVENKQTLKIDETLKNTGAWQLERKPRTNQLTKDIIDVLLKHNLIDNEDDVVEFDITIRS